MTKPAATETKCPLPPHLVELFKRLEGVQSTTMREPAAEIIDRTPTGYGPRG